MRSVCLVIFISLLGDTFAAEEAIQKARTAIQNEDFDEALKHLSTTEESTDRTNLVEKVATLFFNKKAHQKVIESLKIIDFFGTKNLLLEETIKKCIEEGNFQLANEGLNLRPNNIYSLSSDLASAILKQVEKEHESNKETIFESLRYAPDSKDINKFLIKKFRELRTQKDYTTTMKLLKAANPKSRQFKIFIKQTISFYLTNNQTDLARKCIPLASDAYKLEIAIKFSKHTRESLEHILGSETLNKLTNDKVIFQEQIKKFNKGAVNTHEHNFFHNCSY